jgi:hypothetical protein
MTRFVALYLLENLPAHEKEHDLYEANSEGEDF